MLSDFGTFLELTNMTIEQIKSILAGAEETLRLLQSQPEYQAIENSDDFTTENDVVLKDAIQTLSEIYQAIVESKLDDLVVIPLPSVFDVCHFN